MAFCRPQQAGDLLETKAEATGRAYVLSRDSGRALRDGLMVYMSDRWEEGREGRWP